MNEIILNVEGMMCGGCEKRIENALGEVKAIKNIKANHEDGTVKIESKKEIDMDVVKEKIENLGFCCPIPFNDLTEAVSTRGVREAVRKYTIIHTNSISCK